ncbi:amino acid adenylation domain-containing protein [Streptacidiphilus sp. EB129]|uniref:amino acid adenylation domain-containing protein n=1 Tax=Streptacidiphilus sp. EB129 TaxID=3156262 RepID=UPI003516887E
MKPSHPSADPPPIAAAVEDWITRRIAEQTGLSLETIDPRAPFADFGLSSRDAVQLVGDLQEHLSRELSPTLLWHFPTPRALSEHLADERPEHDAQPAAAQGSGSGRELGQGAERGSGPVPGNQPEPVAIVGIGCRFPGADGPDAFWQRLAEGADLVGGAGRRLELLGAHKPLGLLDDIDGFDAEFFSLSGREAAYLDPQQRLLLECAWEALEGAGIAPPSLAGTDTGVFVGVSNSDFGRLQSADTRLLGPYSGSGQAHSIAANRVSYTLDLGGPSLAVDTACSSSLVAVHLACRSLRSGESTTALAGGVNVILAPDATEVFEQAGMMAADGRCKTFDASADGYVRAEGCGVLVLKTLSAARRDGDPVLAVILGSAVNQDGRSNGLTAPSAAAQRRVVRAALRDAGVEPAAVGYVEAHGTGTPLGDPIEISALRDVLAMDRSAGAPLLVGSVKTNLGHAESAAGVAGLIKTVLMLRHGAVAPHLHLREVNPEIDLGAQLAVPTTLTDWPSDGVPRVAGVSSFGFGGTNAHVIVGEAPRPEPQPEPEPVPGAESVPGSGPLPASAVRPVEVLTASARSRTALTALVARYAEALRDPAGPAFEDLCHTANTGRAALPHRLAITAGSREEALTRADRWLGSGTAPGVRTGRAPASGPPGLAFLFPGQGSQYPSMARKLYETDATFRRELDGCDAMAEPLLGRPLTSVLFAAPTDRDLLGRTRWTQPALFAVEYALARLWLSWGVEPDYLLGHSVGALAAACVAGVFGPEDGMRLAVARGRLVEELTGPGRMLLVLADEQTVGEVLEALHEHGTIGVAAVNSERTTVVSGSPDGVAEARRRFAERGVTTHELEASYAFHSPMMAPARAAFAEEARSVRYRDPAIPLVSDTDGRLFDAGLRPDADHWARHLEQPVRFADGLRALAAAGCSVFLETGPGRALIGAGRRTAPDATWLASLRDGAADWAVLADSASALHVDGRTVDWAAFDAGLARMRVPIPSYPFERRRHWLPDGGAETAVVPGPRGPAVVETPPSGPSAQDPSQHAQPDRSQDPSPDPVLSLLAATVARVLENAGPVDPDSSFLELGADSLALMQTLQTVQQTFAVKLPISRLFEEVNTLRLLAAHIRAQAPAEVLSALTDADHAPASPAAAPVPSPTTPPTSAPHLGAASPGTGTGPVTGPVPVPVSGPVEDGSVERFLSVHAQMMEAHTQVMGQAYELLRGGARAAAAPSAAVPPVPPTLAPYVPVHAAPPRPDAAPDAVAPDAAAGAPLPEGSIPRQRIPLASADTFVAFRPAGRQAAPATADPARRAYVAELVARHCARTAGSKAQAVRERGFHSDVRHAVQPYLNLRETRYPLVVERSEGARLWDVDGNEYLDLTMGFGVNFFGHGEPLVDRAIREQLALGMHLGPHNTLAAETAELICELTGTERAVFCNTGSEAVMVAVRLARTVTGRAKIALFAGAYHGSADPILARQGFDGGTGESVPLAPGIPDQVAGNVLVLPYDDPASLEALREHAHELAAVLVEPVQSRRPDVQPGAFLRELRELTREAGVALIFDEVITGFRMHPGGAQALFGVDADLATYGKVIGGGLPIGVVAGRAEYLDAIDGGAWTFGDTPYPHATRTFFTGTFCKHPLALAAGRAVLREMKRRGPELQAEVSRRTSALASEVNSLFAAAGVPIRITDFGSLFRLRFLDETQLSETVEVFHTALLTRGVYVWEGRNCFLSTAHGDQEVARIVAALAATADEMTEAGFFPGAVPVGPLGDLPLSDAQQELWLLGQMGDEHSRAYNESLRLDLRGPLDLPALRAAVLTCVGRHESLRTVFSADGGTQRVRAAGGFELPLVEFTDAQAADWADLVFDLEQGPLLRAAVRRLAEEHHQLLVTAHHTVVDGWSFGIVLDEIGQAYTAAVSGGPDPLPVPHQYREHVRRQLARRGGEQWQADEAYWLDRFGDGVPALQLPTDRPRPARDTARGGSVTVELDERTSAGIAAAGSRLGCTPFTLLLAAYAALLHRLSGQDDLVVGVPVALRDAPGADRIVGNCSSVLPIRSRLGAGDSVRAYTAGLQRSLVGGFAHSGHPFAALRSRLPQDGDGPLYRTMFNLDQEPEPPKLAGLDVSVSAAERHWVKSDLDVDVLAVGGRHTVTFEFNGDLFDEPTVRRYVSAYQRLLQAFLDDPEQPAARVALAAGAERQALVALGRAPRTPRGPETSAADLVEAWARRTPDALAVAWGSEDRLSYRELNEAANRLAHHLRAEGHGPDTRIGVLLERGSDLLVAVLGIWKAGAGYLALDLETPTARRAAIVEDAGPALVLTHSALLPEFSGRPTPTLCLDAEAVRARLAEQPGHDPRRADLPDGVAFIVYTSGSTGRPKGVVLTHRGLLGVYRGYDQAYGLSGRITSLLQMANFGFDVFAGDVVRALCSGAALVLCPRDLLLEPAELLRLMRREGTDYAEFVPLVLKGLAEHMRVTGERLDSIALVVCGADVIYHGELEAVQQVFGPRVRVLNAYGLTEATIDSTYVLHQALPGSGHRSLIGAPFPNAEAHILDGDLQPVPPGVPGLLYVGGDGLARGYLGRPDLTAERFVPHPWGAPGERLYCTGDLACYRHTPDGLVIEHLGRRDGQIKIRGYRIELGEVEAAVRAVTGIGAVAVIDHEAPGGGRRLLAHVATGAVPNGGGPNPSGPNPSGPAGTEPAGVVRAVAEWNERLRAQLPGYMVPDGFVLHETLPANGNGKLDRAALRAAEGRLVSATRAYQPPRNTIEARLLDIWREVLGSDAIGVGDDFFALGGHSLQATRVAARVRAELGVELPLRRLFENPTVAALAARLGDGGGRPPLVRAERPEVLPLSYAQQRLWFIGKLEGPSPTYNLPMPLRLTGDLDRAALAAALADVVARHEPLRTVFAEQRGVPRQRIVPAAEAAVPLTERRIDPAEVPGALAEGAAHTFNLSRDLPVTATLFEVGPSEQVLLLVLHHAAGDGWSLGILARDLLAAYAARRAGRAPQWTPLPVQYADYTLWQLAALGGDKDPGSLLSEQLAYWRQALAGLPDQLELPVDRPRPAVAGHAGDQLGFTVDAAVHGALARLARENRASVFMVVQAALAVLLDRYGAGSDIPIGTPVSGRTDQALDELVGFFVNTLVLRTDTSGNPTFRELLERVRDTDLAAFGNQDLPFERLVQALNPPRSRARHPLFQVMLGFETETPLEISAAGLAVTEEPDPTAIAKFDLFFSVQEQHGADGGCGGLVGALEYRTDLFDRSTAEALAARLVRLLTAVSNAPETRCAELPFDPQDGDY